MENCTASFVQKYRDAGATTQIASDEMEGLKQHLDACFCFSVVWGCGGTVLTHADRTRFDAFVRAVLSGKLGEYSGEGDSDKYAYDMPGLD